MEQKPVPMNEEEVIWAKKVQVLRKELETVKRFSGREMDIHLELKKLREHLPKATEPTKE